ncbi:MAG TPA: AAA family ATPase [Thermoanaerobacterales bacterium]|nr:AAA family ATPase [Thermoanaerobacterales bacterium]
MLKKLLPCELAETCDEKMFSFRLTKDLEPLSSIIGQERAVNAMDFGLKINHSGYNIFITGLIGTGRTSYANLSVTRVAKTKPVPDDIIYVYNFVQPEKPMAISLPAGKGTELKKDMNKLISEIKTEIMRVFNTEEFERQIQTLVDKFQKASMAILGDLEDYAREKGFSLQKSPQGIFAIPLKEGKPMKQEEYDALSREQKDELEELNHQIQIKIDETLKKIRSMDKKARDEITELEKKTALAAMNLLFEEITVKYREFEEIIYYLKSVKEDIIKNLAVIREERRDKIQGDTTLPTKQNRTPFSHRYDINIFVDNKSTKGAPVIFETNPTYYNLFGKIEGKAEFGAITTDFMMIRSGAIHRANGGYLVIQASDLLKDPYAWTALKRTLKNGESRVENIGEQYRAVPTVNIKPKTIPIDVKVILIGTPYIYDMLNMYDEDFRKFFKIKVDFDVEMDRTPENLKDYTAFVCNICKQQELLPFDSSGVARVIDYSSRLAEDKNKLSTRFNEIVEVIYEAGTWAEIEGSLQVTKDHVDKAISEKIYRSNRVEEKMFSMIECGDILVETEGSAVGQVNGLSVLDVGDYIFGQPSKITARTYLGDQGVVNIEREAKLSGHIHNKAVMIITGFLGQHYAKDMPLTISASIAFEQNYGGIEGDSASCAELIALLSSISGIPVRQDMAITGSMNQHGDIQPVGGTTYKIEGFYKACKIKGLIGTQGVVIPSQNIANLMLKPEVVEAVENGKFHIYAADKIDDAIEIMTGESPKEFHRKVKEALRQMAETVKKFNE